MHTPYFSIITATFNAVGFVDSLASSLKAQTFQDFEWIVQDGRSTDGTVDAVRGSGVSATSISVSSDLGIFDALNKAVARSRGEYFLFLGADDRLAHSTALEDLVGAISNAAPALVTAGWIVDGETARSAYLGRRTLCVNTVHHQAAAYHRRTFETFEYDITAPIAADYELHLLAYLERWEVVHAGTVLSICGNAGVSRQGTETDHYRQMRLLRRKHVNPLVAEAAYIAGRLNLLRRNAQAFLARRQEARRI